MKEQPTAGEHIYLTLFGYAIIPVSVARQRREDLRQAREKSVELATHIERTRKKIAELEQENARIRKNVTEVERSEHILNTQLTEINARLTQEIERLRLKYEPEIVEEQLQQVAANPPESVKKTRPKKGTQA